MKVSLPQTVNYKSWTEDTAGSARGERTIEGNPQVLLSWAAGVMAMAIEALAKGED